MLRDMKILITGSTGLAAALAQEFSDHLVTTVSKSNGFNINAIDQWGHQFLDQDCVFNCAYDGFGQVSVLEFFYNHWKTIPNKQIINIGSRAITHKRLDAENGYWPYRQHKQSLQQAVDAMLLDAKCDIKSINPGPINTPMIQHHQCVKFDPVELSQKIRSITEDRTIKRVDLWL
jgi:NAD(P)-dependent dehydrogenase (short-subunit alcohol dehydrogenase family)